MKRLTIAFTALLVVCFTTTMAQQTKAPYVAAYSSNFKIGNTAYANKILELWKDWDDNQLNRHEAYFADTLTMWGPDGSVTHGKAANLEAAAKFRGAFTKAISTVHAWVPLHVTDKNEDVVCIWGTEEDHFADGKVEKRDLHEVWWFNKDGKVSMIRQWAAKFGE